jgi:hypothetical protein
MPDQTDERCRQAERHKPPPAQWPTRGWPETREGRGLSAPTSETGQQDVLALTPLIRRVVAARVRDPQVVDDLVQETFARLLQARPRLDDDALAPFAGSSS